MIPLGKEDFRTYLIAASFTAVKFAQLFVKDKLPFEFSYQLLINDGTPPQYENLLSENEVVNILHQNDRFPVWIDLSIKSASATFTVLELLASDRTPQDLSETYYFDRGTGPFGVKGPAFPSGYNPDSGKKFWLPKKPFLHG